MMYRVHAGPSIRTLGLALAALACLAPRPAAAQAPSLDACGALVGTWVTTITDIEGVFASRSLITLTGDGIVLVNDSGQGGVPGIFEPFTSSQGAWKCVAKSAGNVEAAATALNFVLPKSGRSTAFGRVDYKAVLDLKTGQLAGTVALYFTREGDLESADPIGDPGKAFEEFQFAGRRVTAR